MFDVYDAQVRGECTCGESARQEDWYPEPLPGDSEVPR